MDYSLLGKKRPIEFLPVTLSTLPVLELRWAKTLKLKPNRITPDSKLGNSKILFFFILVFMLS